MRITSNYNQFRSQMRLEWDQLMKRSLAQYERIAKDAFEYLVYTSPVFSGFYRYNWMFNVGVSTREMRATVKTDAPNFYPSPLADGFAEIEALINENNPKEPMPRSVFFNNVFYAQKMEFNNSPQAPSGVVGPTVAYLNAKYATVSV